MKKPKRKKLTEEQWTEIFRIRCRSKRGERLSQAEHDLCTAAMNEDEVRYSNMDGDVFDATVPFGSQARWPR